MGDGLERRAAPRYLTSIPATLLSEGTVVTGVLENISVSGALLTHATGDLQVGATGRLRVINLGEMLRTVCQDEMDLEAEVVRSELGGFALRFPNGSETLLGLLERAKGRGSVTLQAEPPPPRAEPATGRNSVEDHMTSKVVRVEPESPVLEVVTRLRAYRISCVVVCEEGIPVGIITERDVVGVAFLLLTGNLDPEQRAVDLMASQVLTVRTSDPIEHAVAVASEARVRHLPVVDDAGLCVGLLTQTDLLRGSGLSGSPQQEK